MDLDAIKQLGPITIVGHSHIWSIRAALDPLPETVEIVDFWKTEDIYRRSEAQTLEKLRGRPGAIVSIIGTASIEALSMYAHPRPYDFVFPAEPDAALLPGAEIIPFAAVKQTMLESMEYHLGLIELAHGLASGIFLQVETPPTWGHERRVEDWPMQGHSGFYAAAPDRFGPAALRGKMYRVYSQIVREFCHERGIEMVKAPAAAIDENQFLKPEYSLDLVHGNTAYGALVVEAVVERLKQLQTKAVA